MDKWWAVVGLMGWGGENGTQMLVDPSKFRVIAWVWGEDKDPKSWWILPKIRVIVWVWGLGWR